MPSDRRDDSDLRTRAALLILSCDRLERRLESTGSDRISRKLCNKSVELDMVMAAAAADPLYAGDMLCWCVDVVGRLDGARIADSGIDKDPGGSESEMYQNIIRHGGDLAELVFLAVKRFGYQINDIGIGADQWYVGIECDDRSCHRLCSLLHKNFALEIDQSRLTVMKRHTGFRFNDILDVDEARDLLKRRGESRT